jgi:hypothetical protein
MRSSDCERVATEQIEVSAGKYGFLNLSVCVEKFTDELKPQGLNHTSPSSKQIPTKEPTPNDQAQARRLIIGNQEHIRQTS